MHPAQFYLQLENNDVQCRLCHHFCTIKDGQTGICRVRENRGGQLFSLVYGHPAAMNADPIEKKPLFHFLPDSLAYSIGTAGCNLACANCQNYDISQIKDVKNFIGDGSLIPPEEVVEQALGKTAPQSPLPTMNRRFSPNMRWI